MTPLPLGLLVVLVSDVRLGPLKKLATIRSDNTEYRIGCSTLGQKNKIKTLCGPSRHVYIIVLVAAPRLRLRVLVHPRDGDGYIERVSREGDLRTTN